ncbi:MAG: winged helix-turn-helix domain-containing protein [Candidatus Aenigmatarchaeota archaeon]
MPKKIKLGSDVFKALSSDTRMDILRNLNNRRMTVTELSNSLKVSKSTVHEHLSKLSEADLVEKVDGDNKWVYYELTEKGQEILNPKDKTKLVLFVVGILSAGIGTIYELRRSFQSTYMRAPKAMSAMQETQGASERGMDLLSQISWFDLTLGIALGAVTAYLIYRLWKDMK